MSFATMDTTFGSRMLVETLILNLIKITRPKIKNFGISGNHTV